MTEKSEFRVVDVCHNVMNPALSMGPRAPDGSLPSSPTIPEMVEGHIARMEKEKVEKAVINPTGHRRTRGLLDTQEQNNFIAAYRDRAPDRFVGAFGKVEPQYADDALPEIDRCANELGLTGIGFHPRWQGVSTENYWILRYFERIIERGMLPALCAMGESPEESLWKVAYVAKHFPEQEILLRCVFCTWEATSEAFEVAEEYPNLLFDTALLYDYDMIEPFIQIMGSDRVLFGTDLYNPQLPRFDPDAPRQKFARPGAQRPPMRTSHVREQLIESSLTDEQKHQILWGNAKRLFGFDD